ncbi:MAG: 50S ribosomal protein L32 [Patescibacteria group bacterium]|nr:50S ribosomal protein L32 [Patescibacteria group bacterium]
MTPLPKRKLSTRRIGKRKKTRLKSLPRLVLCSFCFKPKIPHFVCKACGK